MGLQSALTTALTGLQAAETTIDVVGNNVANSNTVGFKESNVVFATQFLQTQSIGSAPTESRGGTNPRQIGLGVKVAEISPDFTQGTIEISSNPLDVAIQGDGFLIVQDATGRELYTRNGQLKLNANNEVVTSTGNKVLGYLANDEYEIQFDRRVPLTIPLGAQRVAQETNNAVFAGVLNPASEVGSVPAIVESEVIGRADVDYPQEAVATVSEDAPEISGVTTGFTGVAASAGLPDGTYNYRAVYVDADGNRSAPSNTFTLTATNVADTGDADSNQLDLSDAPTPASGVWTQVEYYREASDGNYYAIGAPVAAGAASPVADTVDDATLQTNSALDNGAIDDGTYTYYVTYFNSVTGAESRPSTSIGPINVTDDDNTIRLDLSAISDPDATSDGVDFDQVRIYRNLSGQSSNFRLVGSLTEPWNSGPTTFADNTPSSTLASAAALDFNGAGSALANSGTLLSNLQIREGTNYTSSIFEPGTLEFTGEIGGADLATKSLQITADTTVQDWLDFVYDSLGLQAESDIPTNDLPDGAPSITISNGSIQIISNMGEENAVEIPLTAFRLTPDGSNETRNVDVSFAQSQQANGPGTTTEFIVYDSLGAPLPVKLTTVLEETTGNTTTYRWFATSGAAEASSDPNGRQPIEVGNGILVFDSNGELLPGNTPRISIPREITASLSPVDIELDFSGVNSLVEVNAQNELVSSLNMTNQDGFAPGVLTDFIVTESGRIQGQFSNGVQRDLGQMEMARFVNPSGLQQVGDSLYNVGVNSGSPEYGGPGENGIGYLTSGAVELSNTDIGQNLIELILASTQYRGGSRVISAAQELLDELMALRR